jgi:ABC-type dipeptide/oligopeptide/nickel transport system ATPase component
VGQAQRVIIAMAILHRPSLLIADEATSALDTITQSEILGLLAQLNRELGMGILYISHDLLSVAALCHRIAILNVGEIVECGPPSQIFGAPQHTYTRKLVAALPRSPFLDSDGDKLGGSAASYDKDRYAKRSEESSLPDQIPSNAR